jgi:hypothetical protein
MRVRRAARSMFERFTERARRVVVLAQEEAWMLNHNWIGTEHLLLGLIHEGEGVAARALESLGISLQAVRQVEEIIGRGQEPPSGHIAFTPRAKKVLELSLREALQLGHEYIGTEHILLGLLREGDGVAAQVLVKLGAALERVRQQVVQLLHGHQGEEPASAGTGEGPRLSDDALARADSLDRRLAAVERWMGMRADLMTWTRRAAVRCTGSALHMSRLDFMHGPIRQCIRPRPRSGPSEGSFSGSRRSCTPVLSRSLPARTSVEVTTWALSGMIKHPEPI